MLTRYAGKFVVLKCCDDGWEIVETGDELDELQELLAASGADVSRVIRDQIHTEDATAPGVELQ